MTDGQTQEKTVDEYRKEAEEYLAGWKRAKADLVNYQKQVERERAEWFMYANAGCVKTMLPVVDALEAAVNQLVISTEAQRSGEISSATNKNEKGSLAGARDDASGIERIHDQMMDVLRQMAVEVIPITREPANPELHEVVGVEKVEGVASGLMVREVQRGYTMHGKTLRTAKVIVNE